MSYVKFKRVNCKSFHHKEKNFPSFCFYMKVKMKVKSLSRVRLFVTPWTLPH